ncbi:MAG: AAA family ATPase [Actinobacteria bacterium]|nr:AAA family ATPase [Actinomycetota bacterium]
MITKIRIKNFKKLDDVEIDLGSAVVFVGPNNSGKTSLLQAISLWELGMRRWAENRKKTSAKKRVGVTINRRDIVSIPVPSAVQLWQNLHVRRGVKENDKISTKNILIEIIAEGFTNGKNWQVGFEFDYANPESIYCRIMHDANGNPMELAREVLHERIGYLPPMSGLAAEEDRLVKGSINSRIGEGRTAEVLRNLCYIIWEEYNEKWTALVSKMESLFKIKLDPPSFEQATGRISMTYTEGKKNNMDLSNAGRGFHQTLLLFAFIYSNPSTVLLMDEPDAHLEILRQRQIYNQLTEIVKHENSQLIIATHSESILGEASQRDRVIAFIGYPHPVHDKSQLVKALTTVGFEQYLLAEQKKRIIFLEGSTDLEMLKAFAKVLNHPVYKYLEEAFVKYVGNIPSDARNHFFALKEAVPDLLGIALFDHLERGEKLEKSNYKEMWWKRREIENYLPIPQVILRYLEKSATDLFTQPDMKLMEKFINDYIPPAALRDPQESWWFKTKMSDDFLDKIFRKYFNEMGSPVLMDKSNYYELALLAKPDELDPEVLEKLDLLLIED